MSAGIWLSKEIFFPLMIFSSNFCHLAQHMLVVILKTAFFVGQLGVKHLSELLFEGNNS
jgi:hypothetical protein